MGHPERVPSTARGVVLTYRGAETGLLVSELVTDVDVERDGVRYRDCEGRNCFVQRERLVKLQGPEWCFAF